MTSLAARYAALVCDLDGVVYRGPAAVPHAVDALGALTVPVVYATNNASRPPADVAAHLQELGLGCTPEQVVTSSDAAAWLLVRDAEAGSRVLAVGGPGVVVALEAAGFVGVAPRDHDGFGYAAVVQGYGAGVTATDLAEAAYAVEDGARWVATNTDATLPTDRGVAPGNGMLVAAVARAVGRNPDAVAGKPHPPLYLLAAERLDVAADRLLAVGDRLDTDIEGAVGAGADSLLVLTGVDDLDAVLDAPAERRPTFVAPDLRWLHRDPEDGSPSLADLAAAVAAVHRAADDGAGERAAALRETARRMLADLHAE
ncbi:HAD-IIA family hydrolase [Phycicoccus duodecadis]|uniref:HAD superfamily hydrolase (TIGR01450 family) n=1 Tax=Phycicoccus duodecadis TaxID=173053 RepID=A0A2N3YN73_9MICO|nr:HAD-IIA family hydrolase [Phycicoccus duodecadis]PKW28305.1 HAD superfamily hydrolase (TIGR01450 family) [Phycicoccus duodecadis]